MSARPMFRRTSMPKAAHGFTLIELMIVVVVVAILSAIAYPSYQEFVQRGRRNEAAGGLLENAQFMERMYTQNMTYVLPAGVTLPIQSTPRDAQARYALTVVTPTASTYTLTATAVPASPDSKCGPLTLDQLGTKSVGSGDPNYCWAK